VRWMEKDALLAAQVQRYLNGRSLSDI